MIEIINTPFYREANMQGYWRFETAGEDSSVNNYGLTPVGAPAHIASNFGKGVDLELADLQYYYVPDAQCANLEIAGAKTYLCWLKFESHTADTYPVAKANSPLTVLTGIRYSTTGGLGFLSSGLTTNTEVNSTTHPTNGVWHFVAGIYTGAKLQIYVDGTLTEVNATGSSTDTNGNFAVGKLGSYNAYHFDGVIDEVAIFNRALSEAELDSIYEGADSGGAIAF